MRLAANKDYNCEEAPDRRLDRMGVNVLLATSDSCCAERRARGVELTDGVCVLCRFLETVLVTLAGWSGLTAAMLELGV